MHGCVCEYTVCVCVCVCACACACARAGARVCVCVCVCDSVNIHASTHAQVQGLYVCKHNMLTFIPPHSLSMAIFDK